MTHPKPLVIVTTGDPVPHVEERRGSFARMIRESIGDAWRGDLVSVDVRTHAPPRPAEAAAFVVTGSASNVPNREAWMVIAEAWLRDVVELGVPTFGICFGHQLLGQALGGDVQRNPRGREIGTVRIERLDDDPIFDDLPRAFDANATHVDSVLRIPEGALRLARSSLDDHQAVRFTRTCYGVQFHPEIDADIMRGYVESRREILASEGFDVESVLTRIEEGEAGRQTLRNFVRHIIG
jgi:GMP synthase (glutamine-hydrolysing)